MRVIGGLAAVLCGTAIVIVSPLVAQALTASQVYSIAQEITVRIDGANTGSGIIIERQGDIYTVVTCWHVVQLKGSYTIHTADGQKYTINNSQVKRLGNVDLAMFQFSSNQNYRVPEKGNSDQVTGGKNVYVAGYPNIAGRNFQSLDGKISGRAQNPKDGYALFYTVQALGGMSGGPILDEEGKLVGIHGRAETDPGGGGTTVSGIPLNTYLTLAPSAPPVATKPTPQPTNSPQSGNANNLSSNFVLSKTLKGNSGSNFPIDFSADGKTLASSFGKTIKIWNVATGQEIRTLNDHSRKYDFQSVAFSPDGKTLASSTGDDNTIKIWNVATGQEIRTLNGHSKYVHSVAFSPDSKTLASGSWDKTIKIWNVATGQEIRTIKDHSNIVSPVVFSPDGKSLASGSVDNTIKIWNVTTGEEINTLKGHSEEINSLAFSPDSETLASSSWDKTIKIWNVATGQEIRTLKGHSDIVSSAVFSPDGKTLVSSSAGDDDTIKIWNVATGQEIRTLHDNSDLNGPIALSLDGKTLASGTLDGIIKIWRLSER